MKKLYVLFDSRCRLCSRAAFWLRTQPSYVEIEPIPANSPRIATLFPSLHTAGTPEELVVVADTGEVYRALSAWLMCLWALRAYRAWALRLARPGWQSFARRAVAFLSDHRQSLSAYCGASSAFEEMLAGGPAEDDSCTARAVHRAIDEKQRRRQNSSSPAGAASP